ncbi:unnamed protein product [Merluccius merluccius]
MVPSSAHSRPQEENLIPPETHLIIAPTHLHHMQPPYRELGRTLRGLPGPSKTRSPLCPLWSHMESLKCQNRSAGAATCTWSAQVLSRLGG